MDRYLKRSNTVGKRIGELEYRGSPQEWPYNTSQYEILREYDIEDIHILEDEIDALIRSPDLSLDIKHLGVSYPPFFRVPGETMILEALAQLGLPIDGDIGSSDYVAVSLYESEHCPHSRMTAGGVCYHGGYAEHLAFLVIEYDNATLSVAHLRVFISQLLVWDNGFTETELGGHALLGLNVSETEKYWEALTERIASFISNTQNNVRDASGRVPIKRYLATGELGHDLKFQGALRLAFEKTLAPHLVKELIASYEEVRDPMLMSAVAAATLTKHDMDAAKPLGCSESIECGRKRKEVLRNSKVDTKKKEAAHREL